MTQKRKIGLLIIVFVALICIYMWVRAWNQSEQAQANTMIRITDTEGDKIKKIALNIENGELNFEKENGVWYDALDHDIPLNQSIMNEIADTVGSISANRKLKNADEAKDFFGRRPGAARSANERAQKLRHAKQLNKQNQQTNRFKKK